MKNRNLFTFFFGAALGSAAVWLFASKKGKQIRSSIKEEAEQLIQTMRKDKASSNPESNGS